MINIIAIKHVKEERQAEFFAMAQELIDNTRKEEGCISYNLTKSITDKDTLAFVEQWSTEEIATVKHRATPHFQKIVPMLGELCYKEGELYITTDKVTF